MAFLSQSWNLKITYFRGFPTNGKEIFCLARVLEDLRLWSGSNLLTFQTNTARHPNTTAISKRVKLNQRSKDWKGKVQTKTKQKFLKILANVDLRGPCVPQQTTLRHLSGTLLCFCWPCSYLSPWSSSTVATLTRGAWWNSDLLFIKSKYSTFCRENLDSAVCAKESGKFAL